MQKFIKLIPLFVFISLIGNIYGIFEPFCESKRCEVVHSSRSSEEPEKIIYVIPVKGIIERALVYVVRRGLKQAVKDKAAGVILDMNTLGGRLDATEEIANLLCNVKLKTYAYVNTKAISAGAIIALATDEIYMAERSIIGAATPVLISELGGAENIPGAIQEKYESYVSAFVRSIAQRKGHDPDLAEAFVRRDKYYEINGKVISDRGQLLTLTDKEAEVLVGEGDKQRRLLSCGTVPSIEELIEKIVGKPAKIVNIQPLPYENLGRIIEMLSGVILFLAVMLLTIEFRTPGFGIAGILGIVLLAIWFLGYNIAGLAGWEEGTIIIFGLILLFIELFITPGFGVLGITGIVLLMVGIFMCFVEHFPGGSFFSVPILQLERAGYILSFLFPAVLILGYIISKYLPKIPVLNTVLLTSALDSEKGFSSADLTLGNMIGLEGIAVSDLRPSGIGDFNGKRLDVVADSIFIDAGTRIKIVKISGNHIIVDKVER